MAKFCLSLIIFCLSFNFIDIALADNGSFMISPAKIELSGEINEGKSFTITLENNLPVKAVFDISVEDLTMVGEDLKFYGFKNGPYSLRNFITPELGQVTLMAGEIKKVDFEVNLPATISRGSLHGVVFFTHESLGEGNTQVRSRLGTLIFIKNKGDKNEAGFLREVITRSKIWSFFNPEALILSFKNTGNTYLSPYGVMTVTNLLTRKQEIVIIEPWFVLPDSTRLKEISLGSFKNGFYQAEIKLNRGYGSWQDVQKVYFISGIIGFAGALVFILLIFSILVIKWCWFRRR